MCPENFSCDLLLELPTLIKNLVVVPISFLQTTIEIYDALDRIEWQACVWATVVAGSWHFVLETTALWCVEGVRPRGVVRFTGCSQSSHLFIVAKISPAPDSKPLVNFGNVGLQKSRYHRLFRDYYSY